MLLGLLPVTRLERRVIVGLVVYETDQSAVRFQLTGILGDQIVQNGVLEGDSIDIFQLVEIPGPELFLQRLPNLRTSFAAW